MSNASPKLTPVSDRPTSFAVPPLSPTNALTLFPPTVNTSAVIELLSESVTVALVFLIVKSPVAQKKFSTASVILDELYVTPLTIFVMRSVSAPAPPCTVNVLSPAAAVVNSSVMTSSPSPPSTITLVLLANLISSNCGLWISMVWQPVRQSVRLNSMLLSTSDI